MIIASRSILWGSMMNNVYLWRFKICRITVTVGTPAWTWCRSARSQRKLSNTWSSIIRGNLTISGVVPNLLSNHRLQSCSFFKMHVSYTPVKYCSSIAAYGGLLHTTGYYTSHGTTHHRVLHITGNYTSQGTAHHRVILHTTRYDTPQGNATHHRVRHTTG